MGGAPSITNSPKDNLKPITVQCPHCAKNIEISSENIKLLAEGINASCPGCGRIIRIQQKPSKK